MSAVISTIFAPASDSPKDIPRQHADDALKRTGASASSTVGLRRHCPRWYRCRPRSKKQIPTQQNQPESRSAGLLQRLDPRKGIARAVIGNEICEVIHQLNRRDKKSRSVPGTFLKKFKAEKHLLDSRTKGRKLA